MLPKWSDSERLMILHLQRYLQYYACNAAYCGEWNLMISHEYVISPFALRSCFIILLYHLIVL